MSSKKFQINDERFGKVTRDPRFWEMPEKERKIKIDKRFQSMFHDQRFKVKYTVDKRGRPINHTTAEDLKRFYNVSDSDEDEGGKMKKRVVGEGKKKKKKEKNKDEVVARPEKQPVKGEAVQRKDKTLKGQQQQRGVRVLEEDDEDDEVPGDNITDDVTVSSGEEEETKDEDEEDEEEEEEDEGPEAQSDVGSSSEDESGSESDEDSDSGPDLARGVGNIETSSDEDEDDDDVDAILKREEEEIEHDWGDLCKDAPRSDEVSTRLAVCNMDWDRMKAKDLLAVLNSFKPKGGVVLSVKIYPSEFGKERMQAENTQGPMELMDLPDDPEVDTKEEKVFREKMRDYQFKRMKYYYAVAECDSRDTAAKIYEECDGFEYESSCSMLDLRFIPDDVTFEDEPKDVAVDVDLSAYTPKLFTSTAAATSKVEVTWDETDHDRVTAMNRKFNKDELLDMDFKAYLASSSEEENEEEDFEFGGQTEEKGEEIAKGFGFLRDGSSLGMLREMMVMIRIWGLLKPGCLPIYTATSDNQDSMSLLFRLLTRLWLCSRDEGHPQEPDESLIDECCLLPSQLLVPSMDWLPVNDGIIVKLQGKHPLRLQFGKPYSLPGISPTAQVEMFSRSPGAQKMDNLRCLHMGVCPTEESKACTRCGCVTMLRSPNKTNAMKQWEQRWIKNCLCGGLWRRIPPTLT